ncbi:MAG TPA: hypothetical protein VKZ18_04715 [Polyangia bacterium]|nr:hypothetical protein [Polyangia bacterium]
MQRLPRAMRGALVLFGFAGGLAATWSAALVGLTMAESIARPRGCTSRLRIAYLRVKASRDAIDRYLLDHGRCPSSHRPLIAERYLDEINLRDPWGVDIALTCAAPGGDTRVTAGSAGPDRVFGTPDDISIPAD